MRQLWQDVGRDTRLIMIAYALWAVGEGLWMFIQPLYLKELGATPGQAGFVIEDLVEPRHARADAEHGSFAHRSLYVAPYVRIKARRNKG